METIGHILKKTRESKSLTIAEINKKTRIHSEVLTALEEGRCDQILSYTYAKSFLKKYCDFWGLIRARYSRNIPRRARRRPAKYHAAKACRGQERTSLEARDKAAIEKVRALTVRRIAEAGVLDRAAIVAIMLVFGLVFAAKKAVSAIKGGTKGRLAQTIQPKKAAQAKKDPSFREFYIPKDTSISVTIKTKDPSW